MTYEEVAAELMTLGMQAGEHVYVVKGEHLDTTALYVLPVAWFIAFGPSGEIYIGTYEGPDNRLVGKKRVAFSELTPQFIKDEVTNALAEVVGLLLDPEVLKEFLKHRTPRPGSGNADGRSVDPFK